MDTITNTIGLIASIVTLIGVPIAIIRHYYSKPKHTKKIKKLSGEKRAELLSKILQFKHTFVIELYACAYVFMPNGEIIFGAAWTNYEWVELLKNFIEKNPNEKLSVATVGTSYYLSDLISGKNIRIPIDPQKGMTIQQSGAEIGQILMFMEY